MIIEGPDFVMTSSVSDESDCFDLQLLQHVASKTNPRDELRLSGYGISTIGCIDRIARNRVARKHKGEEFEDTPMTLKQYHDDFLQAIEEVKQILNGSNISKK